MVVEENIESFAHIAPKWQPEENTSVIKIKLYAKTLNKEKPYAYYYHVIMRKII